MIRLLTYNVRYFGHRMAGLASQDRTMRDVAHAIATLSGGSPDLICLQEIETGSIRADMGHRRSAYERGRVTQLQRFMDFFAEELKNAGVTHGYRAFYFPAHVYRVTRNTNLYTTGLATLVHEDFEVVDHNADLPFEITHRRISWLARLKQTRVCGHVRLNHPVHGLIDLFNTHLSLPAFFTRDLLGYTQRLGFGLNQLEEVAKLSGFINDARQSVPHTLLVGDFNSLPGSSVWRAIIEELGLSDALRDHNVLPKDFATAGTLGLQLPIDYIFASDGFKWLDFEGTKGFGATGSGFNGLSDHVPLVARLEPTAPVQQLDGVIPSRSHAA